MKKQRKSIKRIYGSFLELTKIKGFDKISIQEIANVADVSRGSVYQNFEDKYDLRNKIIEYYLIELFSICSNVNAHDPHYFSQIITLMYAHLESNLDLFTQLFVSDAFAQFRIKFEQTLYGAFKDAVKVNKLSHVSDTSLQFLTAGITGCIVYWLANPNKSDASKSAKSLIDFMNGSGLLIPFQPNV